MSQRSHRATAALAAAALLSGGLCALTPMAFAADDATLTLNAAENMTLAGHAFDFYRIGSYADVQAADGAVVSFGLTADPDAAATWLEPAIKAVNAADPDTADDIVIPSGLDAAGAIAKVTDATTLRRLAARLADSADKPAGITGRTSETGTLTVTVPQGLYLVVDSNGLPMILGTRIDGMDLAGQTLGVAVIKSKAVEIEKKLVLDSGEVDEGSLSVGDTADWEMSFTLPNTGNDATTVAGKLVDEPTGQRFVPGSVTATLTDGTDVTGLLDVYGGGETIPASAGVPGDEAVTIADDGFGVGLDRLMARYSNRAVVVRARTVITATDDGEHPQNVRGVFRYWDGTATVDIPEPRDSVQVTSYAFDLTKVAESDHAKKLDGAGFKIRDGEGRWMAYDRASGAWSRVADEATATEFWTGDTTGDGKVDASDDAARAGMIRFTGLAAGTYTVTETTAPAGYSTAARPSFTAVIDAKSGTVTFTGEGATAHLTVDLGGGVQVANVSNLMELPLTGGGFTLGEFLTLAVAFTVLAGASGTIAVRKRHDARNTTITA